MTSLIRKLGHRDVRLLILVSLTVGTLSAYMHSPQVPSPLGNLGLKYNDIVYGVFYPRFTESSDRDRYWYNVELIYSILRGIGVCPRPYVDYMFEYPPLVALLWYISTCISIKISSYSSDPGGFDPATFLNDVARIHYTISVIPLIAFLSVTAFFICSVKSIEAAIIWLLLPSTVLYSTYNWDIICAALALTSLSMFQKRRYFTSGLLLGLSIATKIMTVSIAYVLLVYLLLLNLLDGNKGKELINFLSSLLLTGVLPYIIILVMAPRGFWDFISHHSSWYCENCLYLVFVHNVFDPTHRLLAALAISLLAIVLAIAVYYGTSKSGKIEICEISTYAIIGAVTLNYVFSPQMILLISPFVVAFLSSRLSLKAYVIADIANFFIMFFFFLDKDLRAFLNSVGIPLEVKFNPWGVDSPVQWIATIRNILLLVLLTIGLARTLGSIRHPEG